MSNEENIQKTGNAFIKALDKDHQRINEAIEIEEEKIEKAKAEKRKYSYARLQSLRDQNAKISLILDQIDLLGTWYQGDSVVHFFTRS